MYSFWKVNALALRNETGASQTFALQHVGANLIQQGIDKGGNTLGIETGIQQCQCFHILIDKKSIYQKLTITGWTTLIDWENEADDDRVRSVSIDFTKRWEKRGKELGVYLPFVYMNDASRDQNPLASYGSENLARMMEVSRRYDPKRVFQTLQNDGFLLSKL